MSETIFDKVSDKVTQNLTERPEAFADRDFLKRSAEPAASLVQSDLCNRTPLNQPLPANIVAALNLALIAEYLETEFYSRGLNTAGLIPNELRFVFTRILLNEVGHRETLLTVLGSQAVPKPTFDFTAGGLLPNVFSNFQTFLNLGRAFEDNGVRAYKGQAGNVMENDFILTTALRFHSVEARHASELRRIAGLKGWITLNLRGNLPAAFQGIYNGEENVVQLGINLTTTPGRRFSPEAVSEAFDEPLTADQVRANVRPFIVGGGVDKG